MCNWIEFGSEKRPWLRLRPKSAPYHDARQLARWEGGFMRFSIRAVGCALIAGVVFASLPLAVVAHERRALGGFGGPGDERYIVDIGFRDEPVTVDQPNAL